MAPFALTGKTVEVSSDMKALPVKQVSKRSGEFLHWSADGASLHWSHGATLYTRELKNAFGFLDGAPEELPEPVAEGLDLSFQVAADVPAGMIALVGGRVVTMRQAASHQEVIDDGVVLVEGNRIAAVGAAGEIEIPSDTFTPGRLGQDRHPWSGGLPCPRPAGSRGDHPRADLGAVLQPGFRL